MNKTIKKLGNKSFGFDPSAFGKGLWKEVTSSGKLGKVAKKEIQKILNDPNTQEIDGVVYAFDSSAFGKGVWKEVTSSGKLGKVAKKEIQEKLGGSTAEVAQVESPTIPEPITNTKKISEKISETTPKPERLKSYRSLLSDPNETVKSATFKSIRQNLRPEMIVKNLFGDTLGMMTAKALKVSPERMGAITGGFDDIYTRKRKIKKKYQNANQPQALIDSSIDTENSQAILESVNDKPTKSNKKRDNITLVRFADSSKSAKDLEKVAKYAESEQKRRDLEENFKNLPQKQELPSSPQSTTTATSTNDEGKGGLSDIISSMFSGLLGGPGAGGLAGFGKKLLRIIGKAFIGLAKKLPIIGPVIIAAMGLKDAYDEFMGGGDFSDAVGAFFESVADSLTFGLASTLAGEGGIKKYVSGMVDGAKDFFQDAIDTIKDKIQDLINIPKMMLNKVKDVIGDILESIGGISFTIPEYTILPGVKVGPFKIAPFSSLAESGKSLKESAAASVAEIAAKEQKEQQDRSERDAKKQEDRSERDAAKGRIPSAIQQPEPGTTAIPQTPADRNMPRQTPAGEPIPLYSERTKIKESDNPLEKNAESTQDLAKRTGPAVGYSKEDIEKQNIQELNRQQLYNSSGDPIDEQGNIIDMNDVEAMKKHQLRSQSSKVQPIPEKRNTGEIINQSASQLAATKQETSAPAAVSPVINNITNNNTTAIQKSNDRVASVRNEDDTFQRLLNMQNSIAIA
jgi:hypothetical protein